MYVASSQLGYHASWRPWMYCELFVPREPWWLDQGHCNINCGENTTMKCCWRSLCTCLHLHSVVYTILHVTTTISTSVFYIFNKNDILYLHSLHQRISCVLLCGVGWVADAVLLEKSFARLPHIGILVHRITKDYILIEFLRVRWRTIRVPNIFCTPE
jgi:hypothetical protein